MRAIKFILLWMFLLSGGLLVGTWLLFGDLNTPVSGEGAFRVTMIAILLFLVSLFATMVIVDGPATFKEEILGPVIRYWQSDLSGKIIIGGISTLTLAVVITYNFSTDLVIWVLLGGLILFLVVTVVLGIITTRQEGRNQVKPLNGVNHNST